MESLLKRRKGVDRATFYAKIRKVSSMSCIKLQFTDSNPAPSSVPTGKGSHPGADVYSFEESERTFLPPSSPFRVRRRRSPAIPQSNGMDYFTKLPDEMVLQILKWMTKQSLGRFAQSCTRHARLARDEALWENVDVLLKIIAPVNTNVIFTRKPVYLRMARAMIQEPSGLAVGQLAQQLKYLDLSYAIIEPNTLTTLLGMCTSLEKLSVEQLTISPENLEAMNVFAESLDTLNMSSCLGLMPGPLSSFLDKCASLTSLNLSCITQHWTEDELSLVISNLPHSLEFLNLAGYRTNLIDEHVRIVISRCRELIDLDFSDCHMITEAIIGILPRVSHLQHLALSRCYSIDSAAFELLPRIDNLTYLDIFHYDDKAFRLRMMLFHIAVNQYQFSAVARPSVGDKLSAIWNHRVKDRK